MELSEEKGGIVGQVKAREVFVDGIGVGDVGNIVIKDRQSLSENGLVIILIGIEKGSNQVVAGPDVVSRGFVYVRESDDLMIRIEQVAGKSLEKCKNTKEWGKIKAAVKEGVSDFIWKEMKRNPVILPIIMEV